MNKKVSVILTVYNNSQWLNQCIDSVLNQTYSNLELIILEDNSSDKNVELILSSYNDDRIKIYKSNISEDQRKATARYATLINIGIRDFATGDYITYLTNDDYYHANRLEAMVNALEDECVDVVYGAQRLANFNDDELGTRWTAGILDIAACAVDHNSLMHRANVFYEAGGWDDHPMHWGAADAVFWNRISATGRKFYPVDGGPFETKRYHDNSVQSLLSNGIF
jgi:glycosyltransferase involved in cell wall biosynthesis